MTAYACVVEPPLARVIVAIAIPGAVLLAFVLWRRMLELLAWAIVCDGAAYVTATIVHGATVNGAAPVVGGVLLLCAELAAWSLDERYPIRPEPGVVLRRAASLAALCAGGALAAGLVLAFAVAPFGGGVGWTLLGALAAIAIVGAAARLARD